MRLCYIIPTVICGLILVKVGWVVWACRGNGSWKGEKQDILQRRNWLTDKVVTEPELLLKAMPGDLGAQFQGEWALYSCSMLAETLADIARIYPETREESIAGIDSLIGIAMSPELRRYDAMRWGEDPLESLDGNESHVSYLSHLAWMIGNYRMTGGDGRYDGVHDSICSAMNRRILLSPLLNLPTYPGEPVYIPDMMVAIVALSDYSRLNDDKYGATVRSWLARAQTEWLDEETGLLVSYLGEEGQTGEGVRGSYAALNCYYLTKIDPAFAREQYERLKSHFRKRFPFSGIREYRDRSCWFGMDVDAGPILFNLSPSGTAFAIGAATYFDDRGFRKALLRTAEIAGHTVKWSDRRHYLIADLAPVGEAIALAMRTNWNGKRGWLETRVKSCH